MKAKRMEFEALQKSAKSEPNQIGKLVDEIASLYAQMIKEKLAFNERVNKELDVDLPPVRMGGKGGKGGGDGNARKNKDAS
jgi:hypothetical protein